jgi:hypothetical protein
MGWTALNLISLNKHREVAKIGEFVWNPSCEAIGALSVGCEAAV